MSILSPPKDEFLTVQQHIMLQQRKYAPKATGQFSWLLSGITIAAKIISDKVRRLGLNHMAGAAGTTNVQGETVQKLDVLANDMLIRCLGLRESVAVLASEENDEPIVTNLAEGGRYVILFDPLDGSSNIDCNIGVGTIFSILTCPEGDSCSSDAAVLQPGVKQLAAGYVFYGSSTCMAYTTGQGVHLFTLDPAIGAFVLTKEDLRIPEEGRIYSVNEANASTFPQGYQDFLTWAKTQEAGPYSSRYVGTMVADLHRTLLKGGVFFYPPTSKAPSGKLRLLYEVNPMAFLIEQAGGMATDGENRVLERIPTSLHERSPIVIGSRECVERVHSFL